MPRLSRPGDPRAKRRDQTSARSISEKLLAIGVMSIGRPSWRSTCEREITPRTRRGVCAVAASTTSRWLRPSRCSVATALPTAARPHDGVVDRIEHAELGHHVGDAQLVVVQVALVDDPHLLVAAAGRWR